MSSDILTANYFDIFNIPVSFDFDADIVQQRYRELQKMVHPDNFVGASAQEKRLSLQHTSRINEAFNTLKQPVGRALYLLELKGLDINFDNETTRDADFLMEQMELRETLSEVRHATNPLERLDEIGEEVDSKLAAMMQRFSELYECDDTSQAREQIRKMQFMQKAKNEISDLSASIEDELLG